MKQRKKYLIGWTFVNRWLMMEYKEITIPAYTKKQAIAYFKTQFAKSFNFCRIIKET